MNEPKKLSPQNTVTTHGVPAGAWDSLWEAGERAFLGMGEIYYRIF